MHLIALAKALEIRYVLIKGYLAVILMGQNLIETTKSGVMYEVYLRALEHWLPKLSINHKPQKIGKPVLLLLPKNLLICRLIMV